MRPSSPLLRIGLLLLALLPAACHISDNTPAGRAPLSINADSSLTHRDSVVVIVKTSRDADTLFRGKLTGLDTLKHLPAGEYDGSPALVIIQGYQGGQLVYEERQDYTGGARNPPIITVPLDLTTTGHPSSLDLRPDEVLLILGSAPIRLEANPADVWKDKALVWATGDSSVVTVSRTGEVTPVGVGSTYVRAASGDTVSDASSITVVRALPLRDSLTVAPSVVSINDAVSFRARVAGGGAALRSFAWDFDGDGRVDQAGNLQGDSAILTGSFNYPDAKTYTATLRITDANGGSLTSSAQITVKLDRPTADAGPDFSVAGGQPVRLRGLGADTLGRIVSREWKIGSKNFAPAGDSGLLVFTAPDNSEIIPCVFRVTDDDGLTAEDTALITINNGKAPAIASFLPADTVITIKDTVAFSARAEAVDADLASWSLDLDGDGIPETEGDLSGRSQTIRFQRVFPKPGVFNLSLKVADRNGIPAVAKARITVLLDAPKADAGSDTEVAEGSTVNLHGRARDSLGAISRMEWKLGSGSFFTVSQGDTSFLAPSTPGTLACVFRVMDDDSLVNSDTVFIKIKASSQASLAALAISPIPLSPVFSPDTLHYGITVDNSVAAVTVTPSVSQAGAALMVNGSAIESGKPLGPINLVVGSNVINIVVTAEDRTTSKIYTVSVIRAPSANADLANLTVSVGLLVPSFAPGTAAYTVSVANASDSIKVTPTAAGGGASLKVNGATVASGTASVGIALNEGLNAIVIEVTAQDGTTKKTYTLGVTRPPSANADLAKLAVSSAFLSPTFSAGVTNYSVAVANAIDSIRITPTAAVAAATIKVNGDTVASGTASKPIALNVGANTIRVEVTAPDGVNKDTYTLIVTRAAGTSALLSGLVPSAGTLSPSLNAVTTTYYDTVPYEVQSIRFTPTVAAGAKVSVDGLATASGTASLSSDLNLGNTSIPVVVTAQDGLTQKRYTVVVTRLRSSIADLSKLTVSLGTLSPAFAPGTTSYTDTVPYATASVSITATLYSSTATFQGNGTSRTSGNPTTTGLMGSSTAVPIVVTAQDGTQKTYTVTFIKSAPSANAKLSALTISPDYSLAPAFDPAVTEYQATTSVAYGVLYIQATPADTNATMTLDGSPLGKGKQSNLPFQYGYGSHSLIVTAQDGIAKQTYNFTTWTPGADDFHTGYAWVDDYSASHALTVYGYDYGSTVNFTRTATGRYTLTFPGLAANGRTQGIAQATAYGGPAYCKVAGSANSGDDFVADIACFGADGTVADSKVFVSAQFPRSSATGRNASLFADSATTDAYSPDPRRSYSTSGLDAMRITRAAVGAYRVTLKGMNMGTGESGNAMVTAYGAGNTRCELYGWQLAGQDAEVDVACLDPATGNRKDSPFNLSYMQAVSGSSFAAGAAVMTGAAPDIDGPFAFNTGGGAIQSEELATGRYRLFFVGLGNQGGSRPGVVQVTTVASTVPNTTCTVETYVPADFVVTVDCWDNTGALTAGNFTLQALK